MSSWGKDSRPLEHGPFVLSRNPRQSPIVTPDGAKRRSGVQDSLDIEIHGSFRAPARGPGRQCWLRFRSGPVRPDVAPKVERISSYRSESDEPRQSGSGSAGSGKRPALLIASTAQYSSFSEVCQLYRLRQLIGTLNGDAFPRRNVLYNLGLLA